MERNRNTFIIPTSGLNKPKHSSHITPNKIAAINIAIKIAFIFSVFVGLEINSVVRQVTQ